MICLWFLSSLATLPFVGVLKSACGLLSQEMGPGGAARERGGSPRIFMHREEETEGGAEGRRRLAPAEYQTRGGILMKTLTNQRLQAAGIKACALIWEGSLLIGFHLARVQVGGWI